MKYLAERIQGPILYQTVEENYVFSASEYNAMNRVNAFRPNVGLDKSMVSDTDVLENEGFSDIKAYILKHINVYAEEILQVTKDVEFYISSSWISAYEPGIGQAPNYHHNSVFTGSLCISEEGAPINFNDGRQFLFPGIDFPYVTIPHAKSEHEAGKLSLWPSKIAYMINPYKSVVEMRAASSALLESRRLFFNVWFKGSLGHTGINAPFNVTSRLKTQ